MDADLATPSTLAALDEAIEQARASLSAGRPDEAEGSLTAALGTIATLPAVPDVHRRGARALGLLAMVAFETDGTEAALTALDQAADEAAAADDEELVALTWSLRATVLGRSGRTAASLEALDRAAVHLDALAPRDRTILLMNRGVAHAQADDLEAGVTDLRRAAALAEEHGLLLEQFMATHNLGYLWHLLGDAPAALRAMEEAAELDVDTSRGVSLLDRGRALLEAGLVDEAGAILDEAVAVSAADGQRQAEAEARFERARVALLLGRPREALERLHDAEARFDQRTSGAWVTRCRASELRLRIEQHHRDAADDHAPAAAALAEAGLALLDEVREEAAVTTRHVRVLAAEAAALAGRLPVTDALLPPDDDRGAPLLTARLDEHRARTTVAMVRGDRDAARAQLTRAADELAAASLSATTLDLRTARLAHGDVLARLDLGLAVDAGPLATIEAVDRWRATSARLPPVRPDVSPETARLLTARRQLREELRDRPDPAPEAWEELGRLERRIATSRRAAAHAAAAGSAADSDDDARGFVTAQRLLDGLATDDRDLLVTAVHHGEVIAVGVAGGVPFRRRVGPAEDVAALARRVRADLRTLSTRVLGALEPGIRASLRASSATLATLLLGEAADHDRRLLVVVHGDLVGLPWGLIVPGRPVVHAASTSAWWHARAAAAGRGGAALKGDAAVRVLRGPRLGAAAEEARAVAAAWGVAGPSEASSAADLVDALGTAEVVHVVAHGQHHRQQPLFSSLALRDGPCCLYDVEAAGVRARQVVLASCDAGSATVRPGDEPLGLASGLLALGAASVVAPTCAVPDELLPSVMGRLHAELAAGHPTDEALVAATDGAPDAAAAFVVMGTAVQLAGRARS